VMILSHFLFNENINFYKILGTFVIIVDIFIVSKGYK